MIHRIRLHTPWEFAWRDGDQTSGRATVPLDWAIQFGDRAGAVCFSRKFHWLNPLPPGEQVWLVCEGIGGVGSVELNSIPLGTIAATDSAFAWDITPHLRKNLEVRIELRFDPTNSAGKPGGLFGSVLLEIRADSAGG